MDDPAERDLDPPTASLRGADGVAESVTEDDLGIDELVPVWRDDALVDALAHARTWSDLQELEFDVAADRELIETLLALRQDDAARTPRPEEPVEPRPVQERLLRRIRLPMASLATAAVLAALATSAYTAEPDKPLWAATEILYSQHAEAVRTVFDIWRDLEVARVALATGQCDDAGTALAAAAARIPAVQSEEARTELQDRYRSLATQLRSAPHPAPQKPRPSVDPAPAAPTSRATPERFVERAAPPSPHDDPIALRTPWRAAADGRTSRSNGEGDRSEGAAPKGPHTAPAARDREDAAATQEPNRRVDRPRTDPGPTSPAEELETGTTSRWDRADGGRSVRAPVRGTTRSDRPGHLPDPSRVTPSPSPGQQQVDRVPTRRAASVLD